MSCTILEAREKPVSRINPGFPVPTESEEQQSLFAWAEIQAGRYPELRLLYHIPNGGKRGKAEAGRFAAEGVRSGVPDLCLPVARGLYHGLYIELKRTRGGKISDTQREWETALANQGYCAVVCRGWVEASKVLLWYLRIEA
jgi:hypothetical protein